MFQSRYRAASHFRANRLVVSSSGFLVSISLSSGFSFQERVSNQIASPPTVSISLSSGFSFQGQNGRYFRHRASVQFQSRYRAASHFRRRIHTSSSRCVGVSISLSSGFSFQGSFMEATVTILSSFNLVIERLLISGEYMHIALTLRRVVSISLSSGFSFQALIHAHRALD